MVPLPASGGRRAPFSLAIPAPQDRPSRSPPRSGTFTRTDRWSLDKERAMGGLRRFLRRRGVLLLVILPLGLALAFFLIDRAVFGGVAVYHGHAGAEVICSPDDS